MGALPLPQTAARALRKLGRDLSLARRRRRLTQASLAERCGIGVNTVRRLEKGESGSSLEHLARVLYVLGEIERLENLIDTGSDPVGLVLMDENLPGRIRSRKSSGAM
jgi:transcriptional regulator with XRE-family HTH domain